MYARRITVAATVLLTLAFGQSRAVAQSQLSTQDRSFYLNRPVNHPQSLSGLWEAPDGRGGAVGIHLQLATTVSGDARPPAWTPQSWQQLQVGVFERSGPAIAPFDQNDFSDSVRGGGVTFQHNRLQIHSAPSVDLDLTLQPDGCWHGRFHRGTFDSVVTLCRPIPGPHFDFALSPIVGTWHETSGIGSACIHIAQTGPATFTGWSDSLMVPGRIRFSPTIPRPHLLYEHFGALAKVELSGDNVVSLEFAPYSALCCSHKFIGKLSPDGTTIRGEFPPGPNQSPHSAIFTKRQDDSCVDPAALAKSTADPSHSRR